MTLEVVVDFDDKKTTADNMLRLVEFLIENGINDTSDLDGTPLYEVVSVTGKN